ncbi:hypothetical protein niasHT_022359 [Heterodera trifolii]|uniref:glucuronosyltransferase n=1 Tax=Heterodera trifolii TaxID=157864 RepID=A0ABD2KP89_9BILA
MHSFSVRLRNSLFHALISLVRFLQRRMIERFFASLEMFYGHRGVRLEQAEAAHLFYAGRAEFIAEPIRPISNRIKHFGCGKCQSETRKMGQRKGGGIGTKKSEQSEKAQKLGWPNPTTKASAWRGEAAFGCKNGTNSDGQMAKLNRHLVSVSPNIRQQFPQIDWEEIARSPFVLVSFGSIAKVEFMPEELFRSFLRAFSSFPSIIFLWQTNSEPNAILADKKCQNLPKNVRLVRWAPIKILLAHPNLHYAILHGGVNTVNEALIYGGRPIMGLPLQGDQSSNLQRLVDLGMAVQLDIGQVWDGQLSAKMAFIEQNYVTFSRRAQQISAMVRTYRNGIGAVQQNFWLRWAANKPFLKRVAHKFFHLRYRSSVEHFALAELGTALAFLFAIFMFLSS